MRWEVRSEAQEAELGVIKLWAFKSHQGITHGHRAWGDVALLNLDAKKINKRKLGENCDFISFFYETIIIISFDL